MFHVLHELVTALTPYLGDEKAGQLHSDLDAHAERLAAAGLEHVVGDLNHDATAAQAAATGAETTPSA